MNKNNNVTFQFLEQKIVNAHLAEMYDVLYTNMSGIAPTGNTYEKDKELWTGCFRSSLSDIKRKVILIYSQYCFIGYFQYSVVDNTFKMEDVQFKPEYQRIGIFRYLYSYLVKILPADIQYVEAYANKNNLKSQAVLKHLGLEAIGENASGRSLRFRGKYKLISDMYGADDLK